MATQKNSITLTEYRKKRAKALFKNLIFIIIFFTILAVVLIRLGYVYLLVLISLALLPSIFASLSDRRKGHFASKTVFAFNFSGLMPYLSTVALSGSPNQVSLQLISEPEVWFIIYGFAMFGIGCVYLIPAIVRVYLEIKIGMRIEKIQERQNELIDEWGEEIKEL